eukprot:TRINITY_DN3100_c0_g1_i1.p1 TRINITY_DN3100_c0_g1~~TRINITY_DN3100_c0_g1_i1.p1  ORF type:complete len:514 (+),score=146.98 TRINITY_DN3100_c0_g1_i1:63-1604(+)
MCIRDRYMGEYQMESLPNLGTINFAKSIEQGIDKKNYLHLSIVPPKEGIRNPCAFVCVVDVSGSMSEADPAESGVEDSGFSRLDIVKHSLKTVVNLLEDNDYLGIVTFCGQSNVVLGISQMSESAKKMAQDKIDQMKPDGNTNIWSGLQGAISLITSNPICQNMTTSLMLFTDGESNENPPGGILETLKNHLGGNTPYYSMNTFGFGYNMDSSLLYDISKLGHGINCYLPVCNLVGTTFVNCVCNFLSTAADKAFIEVTCDKGKKLLSIGYEMNENRIDVGTIQYGQPRDFIIDVGEGGLFTAKLTYYTKEGKKSIEATPNKDFMGFHKAYSRCFYNYLLLKGLNGYSPSNQNIEFLKEIADIITSAPSKDDPEMKALLRDITSPDEVEGRITKAFSTSDRVGRWGSHYVRSMIRAHQLQQCHNFKDPGVQVYGGNLFKELREKADKIFCSLPPAVPSRKPAPPVAQSAPASAPQADMQEFYSGGGGGCFDGCLLYTSPSPRDLSTSRMPSSA